MKRAALWLLPAVPAACVAAATHGDGGDSWLFVGAGRTLLSHDWSRAFASPAIQVGPLQLALDGTIGRSTTALAVVVAVAVTLLVQAAARAAGVVSARALVGVGLAAVGVGLTANAFEAGHPADTLLPLLWIVAAADARRGRTVRAAALVGLGAGLETWSVLGLAVLALAPERRAALRGVALGGSLAAALFAPFVLAGHFAMGAYLWDVSDRSLLALVVDPGTHVGWSLRFAQGFVAFAAGIGAAYAARRTRHVVWLVPLAVIAARLALDPLASDYYFSGFVGPALVGLVSFGSATLTRCESSLLPSSSPAR